MRTVYVDSLALLNFGINYLILLATARLTGAPFSRWRLAGGALVGAGYAVTVLFAPPLEMWPFKILVAFLITFIGLGKRQLLRRGILFFGTSFAFGGGVYALWLMTGGKGSFSTFVSPTASVVLLSAAVCYWVLSLGFRMAAKHSGDRLIKVSVKRSGKCVEIMTLVDSGDTLSDPATNKPVLLAEKQSLEPLLLAAEREMIDPKEPVLSLERLILSELKIHMRLIPYRAVGVDSGLLLAMRADEVIVGARSYRGILVAFSPAPLTDGGAYTAIISEDV